MLGKKSNTQMENIYLLFRKFICIITLVPVAINGLDSSPTGMSKTKEDVDTVDCGLECIV